MPAGPKKHQDMGCKYHYSIDLKFFSHVGEGGSPKSDEVFLEKRKLSNKKKLQPNKLFF